MLTQTVAAARFLNLNNFTPPCLVPVNLLPYASIPDRQPRLDNLTI